MKNNELKNLFVQHNKTIYLHTLLIFFCTHSYSSETVLRPEPNSRAGSKFSCPNGQSVSEIHFATGLSRSISESNDIKIGTPGLFVHKRELEKLLSQMKIGVNLDDNGVKHIIPADDPLRKDNSLLVALNAVVANVDGDKKAERRLHELAFQGAPLQSYYLICKVGFTQIGPGFLLIRKRLPKKGIFSSLLSLKTDNAKDALCTVAQGRDARNTALETALTAGSLSHDLITLIQSFDENSPEELAKIQKIREKIRQERKNKTTRFKLAAATEARLRSLVS